MWKSGASAPRKASQFKRALAPVFLLPTPSDNGRSTTTGKGTA